MKNNKTLVDQVREALRYLFPNTRIEKWVNPKQSGDNPTVRWITLYLDNEKDKNKRFVLTITFEKDTITEISIHEQECLWETTGRLAMKKQD